MGQVEEEGSLLLLAGNDLGLGGTLNSLSLSLEFLAELSALRLGFLDDTVLLIKNKLETLRETRQ